MTDHYVAPQVVRLNDSDRASGTCTPGSMPVPSAACYRGNGFEGVCVTGKSPAGECHEGV